MFLFLKRKDLSNMSKKKQKKAGGYVVATTLSALWLGINYYIYYPAFNVQSTEFWDWLLVHSVVVSVIFIIFGIIGRSDIHRLKDSFRDNFKYFRLQIYPSHQISKLFIKKLMVEGNIYTHCLGRLLRSWRGIITTLVVGKCLVVYLGEACHILRRGKHIVTSKEILIGGYIEVYIAILIHN